MEAMLRHTTTIGIRESLCRRYVLERHIESIETPYGVRYNFEQVSKFKFAPLNSPQLFVK